MITLFTTNCPLCKVLNKKLEDKGIDFEKSLDISEIKEQGFMTVPVLKVEDVYMDYVNSIRWVNEQ